MLNEHITLSDFMHDIYLGPRKRKRSLLEEEDKEEEVEVEVEMKQEHGDENKTEPLSPMQSNTSPLSFIMVCIDKRATKSVPSTTDVTYSLHSVNHHSKR